MEELLLGTIIDAFSLDGTVKIISSTNNAQKRYQPKNEIICYHPKSGDRKILHVLNFRSTGKFDFVHFQECNSETEAEKLIGYELRVEKKQEDLDDGYYFYSDLRSCEVVDEENNLLGHVKEIEEFPAQITLRVRRKDKADFFVPFIKDFIIDVDLSKKRIKIKVIEGLL